MCVCVCFDDTAFQPSIDLCVSLWIRIKGASLIRRSAQFLKAVTNADCRRSCMTNPTCLSYSFMSAGFQGFNGPVYCVWSYTKDVKIDDCGAVTYILASKSATCPGRLLTLCQYLNFVAVNPEPCKLEYASYATHFAAKWTAPAVAAPLKKKLQDVWWKSPAIQVAAKWAAPAVAAPLKKKSQAAWWKSPAIQVAAKWADTAVAAPLKQKSQGVWWKSPAIQVAAKWAGTAVAEHEIAQRVMVVAARDGSRSVHSWSMNFNLTSTFEFL